jgi:hypothetical protein
VFRSDLAETACSIAPIYDFVLNPRRHISRSPREGGGTTVRFSARQLVALGQTFRELANLAAAALVFGQFVGEGFLSLSLLAAGTAFWLIVVWLGLLLEGE